MTWGCLAARDVVILKAMTTTYPSQSTASYDSIKLGINPHFKRYWTHLHFNKSLPVTDS
jgi:hypothetical protein